MHKMKLKIYIIPYIKNSLNKNMFTRSHKELMFTNYKRKF